LGRYFMELTGRFRVALKLGVVLGRQ